MSTTPNTIPLAEAQAWTTEWRAEESDYNSHNECNAFLIPVEDLNAVLAEMGSPVSNAYVRAYIGVKTDSTTMPPTQTEKLIIVGTVNPSSPGGEYKDRLPAGARGPVDPTPTGSLWDFTNPCPPDCDKSSPLN